jgi:hypothetical protein
MAKAGKYD